jgi:hypothetical protein
MTVQSPVADALKDAKEFAMDILSEKTRASEPSNRVTVIHHTYYPDYYWWRPTCFDCCLPSQGSCRSSKKEKDDLTGVIVAVAGLVILATSYFLGTEAGKLSDASGRKHNLEQRKISVIESRQEATEGAIKVLNLHEKMLGSIEADAQKGVVLKSSLIASAALAAVGALAGASALVLGSVAAGAGSGLALLFRWGYSDADTALQENAVRLLRLAEDAEGRRV